IWAVSFGVVNVILFFYITTLQSPKLAAFNALVLLVFAVVSNLFSKRIAQLNRAISEKHAVLMEAFSDFMTNIKTVKRLGVYAFAEGLISRREYAANEQAFVGSRFHAKRWFILHSIYFFGMWATFAFLLYNITQGTGSASILILYSSIFISIRLYIERLSEIIKFAYEHKGNVLALQQLFAGVDKAVAHVTQKVDVKNWEQIVLNGISFQYAESTRPIQIPEFALRSGEIVGIVGESGQGKSTLLNILFGAIELIDSVSIDGEVLRSIEPFAKTHMAYVSQEVELFNLSLKENLLLGRKLNQKVLDQGLVSLGLKAWVESLEKGLETIVGEKGVKLSAGQKQRINLLRGLLLEKDILLLDEPTSHLDQETEQLAIAYLKNALQGKTAVIVTHKLEVLSLCDRIYEMQEHTLKEKEVTDDAVNWSSTGSRTSKGSSEGEAAA
ncbi:MAG TPA: ABC transporter ATP-binding protein, partial [Patescibacteria group bacterium]|nr:ABC transporter ATP-binding protein [Patescibacteria group bacterium]